MVMVKKEVGFASGILSAGDKGTDKVIPAKPIDPAEVEKSEEMLDKRIAKVALGVIRWSSLPTGGQPRTEEAFLEWSESAEGEEVGVL